MSHAGPRPKRGGRNPRISKKDLVFSVPPALIVQGTYALIKLVAKAISKRRTARNSPPTTKGEPSPEESNHAE